jgi:hypothetical protein
MTTHPLGGQLTCSSGMQITDEKTHVAANDHDIFTHFVYNSRILCVCIGTTSVTIFYFVYMGVVLRLGKKIIPRSRRRIFYDY